MPAGWYVGELFGACLFGFLLEWISVKFMDGYYYGHFYIEIDKTPLCIALAWAVIIYTSMSLTDLLRLPNKVKPFADALLAINIDLSLDAIAIRLGMWTWIGVPSNQQWSTQWFGVPYINFYGWMFVVFSFSMVIRVFRDVVKKRNFKSISPSFLFPLLTIILGEIILYSAMQVAFKVEHVVHAPPVLYLILPISIAMIVVLIGARKKQSMGKPDWKIAVAPFAFHVYFIMMLFTSIPGKSRLIFFIALLMLTLRAGLDFFLRKRHIQNLMPQETLSVAN